MYTIDRRYDDNEFRNVKAERKNYLKYNERLSFYR